MIIHKGENNKERGNQKWIRARKGAITTPNHGKDQEKMWPLI
jgi:glutamate synthase domain-containing protein 1